MYFNMNKKNKYFVPKGFLFSTAEAGIKTPDRKDIGVIYSSPLASTAGVFTKNTVKSASVLINMDRIKRGRGHVIIINSGNANACTGERGNKDAEKIARTASQILSVHESDVYTCSTGVIGTPLPMKIIIPKVKEASKCIGNSSLYDTALSIMTTDKFPKITGKRLRIDNKICTISGIAKGAGMICPDMATMLCFLITDVSIEKSALKYALKDAVGNSFNRITVDGDMSTNDTVLMMANGQAGNKKIEIKSNDYEKFKKTLKKITFDLSKMIVSDGEGATKVIEVVVKGAKSIKHAQRFAKSIANSLLVKTAIYGNDANWGRIIVALGSTGLYFDPYRVDIDIGGVKVVRNGLTTNRDKEANAVLKGKDVKLTVNLKIGSFSDRVLTCDLTEEYIRLNAEYRT